MNEKSGSPRVDLAREPSFSLGGSTVYPGDLTLEWGGDRHELQPRVMKVLVALASGRPHVVSRDQLVEQCWDGRIVGDDALNRCILALRNLAREFTPAPFSIETIPRVGHRLVEHGAPVESSSPRSAEPPTRHHSRLVLALIALALAVAGLAAWWSWPNAASRPATIAVLPFRSLSQGDPFLAEGISEEILNRLAAEPAFRVAGRTSAAQFRNAADLRKVGEALGVDYVIEGSVQSTGQRIKVNASLVQASDGMRLWSRSYDRGVADIFAIQQEIGSSVASTLSRTLDPEQSHRGSVAGNGHAYRLYLSAKGMLRTRNPQLGGEAIELLRQAVAVDPGFAPAWASLADAIRLDAALHGNERVVAMLPQAEAAARQAVALEPELAEGHGVLGTLLGYRSRAAQSHLRRAAALDPRSPEAQLWLASAENVAGNYWAEIAAYRRALALDPGWFRASRDLGVALAEMGERARAEEIAARLDAQGAARGGALDARIAWIYGDFAEAAQRWSQGPGTGSIWQAPARIALANARFTLGLAGASPPPPPVPSPELRSNLGRFWMAGAPSASVWRDRNRSVAAALVYDEETIVAAKHMLKAGRGGELVEGYDRAVRLLGLRKGAALTAADLHTAPLVALALRSAGRTADADELLARTLVVGEKVRRRGRIPFAVEADMAAVAAVAGRRDQALMLLERAERRGWSHAAPDDLLRLGDEPAFTTLAAEPRFKAMVARFDARIARERAEAVRLGL